MSLNELKPLNKETIQKMGLSTHDLWVVKHGEEIMGPFELETLRQFSDQNQLICEDLLASRADNNDWQPFYEHAVFERLHPELVKPKAAPILYWLLVNGQKKGPHSLMDIEKKLEMEIISLSDVVSRDDGHTWHKLMQDEAFADLAPTASELPVAPTEESFRRAKKDIHVHEEHSTEDNLAGMAYLIQHKDKASSLKLEEITVEAVQTTEISKTLKWKVPTAAAAVVTLVVAGNYFLSSSPTSDAQLEEAPAVTQSEVILPRAQQPQAPAVHQPYRPHQVVPVRDPASLRPHQERSNLTMPNYEAYNTHQEAPEEHHYPEENLELNQNQPQEHSLLGGPQAPVDEYGDNPPTEPVRDVASEVPPVVEESGDF